MTSDDPIPAAEVTSEDRTDFIGGFSDAFRKAPITMLVTSADDGRFVAINEEFTRLTGYGESEIVGRRGDAFNFWAGPAQRTRVLAQIYEHGSVEGVEVQFKSKSGEIITAILSASRALFGDRECVIWHAIDISAQRHAENQLHSQTQNLRAVVSSLERFPIATFDRSGVIRTLFGGKWRKESLGREPEDFRGRRIADLVDPDDSEKMLEAVRKVFETGESREIQVHSSLGGYELELNVWYSPIYSVDGEIESVLAVTRDITSRLQDAEALRRSAGIWRSMVEDVPDLMAEGVLILDAEHTVIWMNRAFERFFGVRRIEHIGVDYRQLVRDKIVGILINSDEFLARALADQEQESPVANYRCHVRRSSSREERWLECTSNPVETGLYAGGRIERFSDVTRGRIAEGLLRQLSSRLRQTKTLESERLSPDPSVHEALDSVSSIVDELRALISSPYSYDRNRKP